VYCSFGGGSKIYAILADYGKTENTRRDGGVSKSRAEVNHRLRLLSKDSVCTRGNNGVMAVWMARTVMNFFLYRERWWPQCKLSPIGSDGHIITERQ